MRTWLQAAALTAAIAAISASSTAVAAITAPSAAAATRQPASQPPLGTPVPSGFVGVDVDGPMTDPQDGVDFAHQTALMVKSGVQGVRVAFSWPLAQPYQSWADVPAGQQSQFQSGPGNVPTSFTATDEIVGLAARRGLTVLPTILYAPGWDAAPNPGSFSPPATPGPYANYLTALIGRYGPHGSFWASNPGIPRLPIRMWQIWNEPNLSTYWTQPFARTYVSLLRAAHAAIKRADPGAKVVLAAITNRAWIYLRQIYQVPGARSLFDVIAVNGFTSTPSNEIEFLHLVRRAVNGDGGQRTPLLATEVSWTSAQGKTNDQLDWNTTESGQAADIAALLPMLSAQRTALGLIGFYYYTWMGQEYHNAPAFNFAGLLRYASNGSIAVKPALGAFARGALTLEGCRTVGSLAGHCAKHA